jgi:hypothetical protein
LREDEGIEVSQSWMERAEEEVKDKRTDIIETLKP